MSGLHNVAIISSDFVGNFLLPRLLRAGIRFEVVLRGLPRRGKPLSATNLLLDVTKQGQDIPFNTVDYKTVVLLHPRNATPKIERTSQTKIVGIKLPQSILNIIRTIKLTLNSHPQIIPQNQNKILKVYKLNNVNLILEEYMIYRRDTPKIQYRLTYKATNKTTHVPLTQNQMLILKSLLNNKDISPFSYISKKDLLKNTTIKETSLPVLISQLRKKLIFFKIPLRINNFYSVGYILKSI